jgi:hypothetical protein
MTATATAPILSTTGAPLTARSAAIAVHVAGLVAHRARVRAEILANGTKPWMDYETLHQFDAEIVLHSGRYDFYNWLAA